jgi:hypothetical protein
MKRKQGIRFVLYEKVDDSRQKRIQLFVVFSQLLTAIIPLESTGVFNRPHSIP